MYIYIYIHTVIPLCHMIHYDLVYAQLFSEMFGSCTTVVGIMQSNEKQCTPTYVRISCMNLPTVYYLCIYCQRVIA